MTSLFWTENWMIFCNMIGVIRWEITAGQPSTCEKAYAQPGSQNHKNEITLPGEAGTERWCSDRRTDFRTQNGPVARE